MSSQTLICPRCNAEMSHDGESARLRRSCSKCGRFLFGEVFPALTQDVAPGLGGEAIPEGGAASCFYHSDKKAAVACEGCGRFLCSLCDLDIGGRHLCSPCLKKEKDEAKASGIEKGRTHYDSIALTVAIVPMITIWGVLFSAPATLVMVAKWWNRKCSVVPRSRIRFWLALLVACAQIAGIVIIVGAWLAGAL